MGRAAPHRGRAVYHGSRSDHHGPCAVIGVDEDNAATLTEDQLAAGAWRVTWKLLTDTGVVLRGVHPDSFTPARPDPLATTTAGPPTATGSVPVATAHQETQQEATGQDTTRTGPPSITPAVTEPAAQQSPTVEPSHPGPAQTEPASPGGRHGAGTHTAQGHTVDTRHVPHSTDADRARPYLGLTPGRAAAALAVDSTPAADAARTAPAQDGAGTEEGATLPVEQVTRFSAHRAAAGSDGDDHHAVREDTGPAYAAVDRGSVADWLDTRHPAVGVAPSWSATGTTSEHDCGVTGL
jgi:hypothetical protein